MSSRRRREKQLNVRKRTADTPEFLENSSHLQYFLDNFFTEEAMIGLEYIFEHLRDGLFSYKCLLCKIHIPRGSVIMHISGFRHRKLYLKCHHPEWLKDTNGHKLTQMEYKQKVKALALQVQNTYGRKPMVQECDAKEAGSNPVQNLKISSAVTPKVLPAVKGVLQKIPSQHTSGIEHIAKTKKLNQLEDFKTNDDFMNYLQKFEIKNDDDAKFLQQITGNCTKVLINYQEEQTKTQASSTLPSNSDPKSSTIASDEAKLSSVNSPKECLTSPQIQLIFQQSSEVTDTFIKSIQHMDVSEVIGALKRISATNPAFREVNIPNLIKYLQDTRRLKNS